MGEGALFCLFVCFTFPSPSLFDLDTITSMDERSRRALALNLATTEYGVPAIFDPEGKIGN